MESEQVEQALPHEVELARKKALLAKVRINRERAVLNRGEVHGRPDKVYVWVNIDPHRQALYISMGYEKVVDDPKNPRVKTMWGPRQDGTHQRADVILYQIDKELHEVINLDNQIQAIEALEGSRSTFKDFAEGRGIPVNDVSVSR